MTNFVQLELHTSDRVRYGNTYCRSNYLLVSFILNHSYIYQNYRRIHTYMHTYIQYVNIGTTTIQTPKKF